MSKFVPRDSHTEATVAKFVAGGGGDLVLEKASDRGEKELDLSGRVTNVNGDGIVHDLARVIRSFYQSLPKDPRLLTTPEKEELYRQIVAALSVEGALTD
ncbi:MAG TPA: hypothetical protein VMU53_06440, partial [Candidatus Sulfotelmatobacter sp.]|nr:hypothetical protein [Candidatus Sulfotelmatobacter sp.]